ncbi:MAG: methanogenesis marker 5 protein [Methanomicrobium sp.]|uniref:methanogenesis marker 5 protein n=1 Tax=Methanomicrobium mobile TaxID=2205 RepID=UPI0005B2BC38|nr:methanogenesis marker 5 protein [Methanomicrobium mobile]MBO7388584.1 methanogenesis marker 5 protein [Methanomicrobium sp.]MBP5082797.1 methanogenesis marker 5 protein [Methanomicrobium sp.]MBQ3684022.1 methanogenesis marker 5 protein [Methanomicrobium sp.]MBQ3719200.1 methanogenesis marker 5 protein [Methanomicrobium sp.]MBQ4414819.1 methanogenesis marker 5 protein [Methanomicrobium sp.]
MSKVFIYPSTSLILSDMVARFGHEPLGAAIKIRERIQTPGFDSPPLQMTPEDPKKGLKYAAVEVPAGVRGRMAIFGPLIEEAEAAVIVNDSDLAFGCMGCARTDELVKFMIRQRKDIPILEIVYPSNEDEGLAFVDSIKNFLDGLSAKEVPK